MTKAPISLQDLRRSLYVKAKQNRLGASGTYVHVCKMETLREAYRWREGMTGRRVLTGSRLKLSRKAERKVFSCRFGMN